uniref:TGF-beta family profile domain-containing protein n=1 Tax=Arion vulgaris TaxID=1028688 RepID=A0A0B6ZXT4_9EUPU
MKQGLTNPRSADISVLLPHGLHCALIILIFTFSTQVTQSTPSRGNDLHLNLEHQKAIVKDLKSRVLQMMGKNIPPSGYNASRHSAHGKLIREFFKSKLNSTTNVNNLEDEDIYLNEPQIHVFHSSDPEFKVPVQLVNTPSSASALTMITFSTNFQQPEVPYHDLLIKSAILRLRINRQKRKLRRTNKLPLKVTFYLMETTNQTEAVEENMKHTTLRSVTVNTLKSKAIKININSHLLSNLVESDNKIVTIGIRVDQTVPVDKKHGNVKSDSKKPYNTTSPTASHKIQEQVGISKIVLQITSHTRDLRKARSKRQDDESAVCSGSLCCRHSIYVDFEDIGWDFVISPMGYTAYYCKGDCPPRYKIANTFTNIKSILHQRSPETVPAPNCAPTGYQPLAMTIFDHEVKDVSFPGMVVAGCRCH